jgi:hypothetical protein
MAACVPGPRTAAGFVSYELSSFSRAFLLLECAVWPRQAQRPYKESDDPGVERPRSRVGADGVRAPSAVDAFYSPIPVALEPRIKASRQRPDSFRVTAIPLTPERHYATGEPALKLAIVTVVVRAPALTWQ